MREFVIYNDIDLKSKKYSVWLILWPLQNLNINPRLKCKWRMLVRIPAAQTRIITHKLYYL